MINPEPACVPRNIDEALDPVIARRPMGRRRMITASATALMAGLVAACQGGGGGRLQGSPCCNLARPNVCPHSVNYDRYNCPSGFHRTVWPCYDNSNRLV